MRVWGLGWIMSPVLSVLLSKLRDWQDSFPAQAPSTGTGQGSHLEQPGRSSSGTPQGHRDGVSISPILPQSISCRSPKPGSSCTNPGQQSSATLQGFFQGSHSPHSPVAAPASLPAPQSPRIICSFTTDLTPLALADLILTSSFQLSNNYLFIRWNLFHLYLDQHPESPSGPTGTCCIPFPLEFCSTARVQMVEGTGVCLWSPLFFLPPFSLVPGSKLPRCGSDLLPSSPGKASKDPTFGQSTEGNLPGLDALLRLL